MGWIGQEGEYIMKDFKYVSKTEYQPFKNEVIELIHLVQKDIKKQFTFNFEFIGSVDRNMVTRDLKSNVGFDFDVNIFPNDEDENFTPKELKHIIMDALNKHVKTYKYDFCEDSKRVITIKVKDRKNSKILHSVDFAIVNNYKDRDGNLCQQYILFNKKNNTYTWEEQPNGFYMLPQKIEWIKGNDLWQKVRDSYIERKNKNTNPHKKSRSIFAETVAAIYNEYGGYDDEDDYDDYDDYDEYDD